MNFADYLRLIDDNGIDTQRLLGTVAGKVEFVFLQFNVDNTKFCAPKPMKSSVHPNQSSVYEKDLRRVDNFRDLGSRTQLDGNEVWGNHTPLRLRELAAHFSSTQACENHCLLQILHKRQDLSTTNIIFLAKGDSLDEKINSDD